MEVRRLALGAGEAHEVRLAGRGARGYVWTWQVTGDADAVAVDAAPAPSPPAALPPGAAVERVYTVRGTRAGGRARIRFAQIRPPYPQEAPYDELVLEVEVTAGRPAGPNAGPSGGA
ncbi:protease inhibitor I42 family protein [Streptomyces sp. NPDC090445]|uniref:protease inhibitor I42 family protein n=1 Tax=Streptomyces sp. NPDC090445 TaxID=3365963 RepID=UPI00381CDB2B